MPNKNKKNSTRFFYKKKLIAIIFPHNLQLKGIKFFTSEDNPFQIGIHDRKKGEIISAHIHKIAKILKIDTIQELLYVQKGKVKVTLYTKDGLKIKTVILKRDDSILLVAEGHSVDILEDARIFEIKQGPYPGTEHAKIYFKDNKK